MPLTNGVKEKVENCTFLEKRKVDGSELNWCKKFQAVCEDIENCEFKK